MAVKSKKVKPAPKKRVKKSAPKKAPKVAVVKKKKNAKVNVSAPSYAKGLAAKHGLKKEDAAFELLSNIRPKTKRISIPAGYQCFIVKPGDPIPEDLRNMITNAKVEEWKAEFMEQNATKVMAEKIAKTEKATDFKSDGKEENTDWRTKMYYRLMGELRQLDARSRNWMMAELITTVKLENQERIKAAIKERNDATNRLNEIVANAQGYDKILDGGFEKLGL